MSASTGPIVAAGAITVFNAVIVNERPLPTQARVIVGTAIAAGGLFLLETAVPRAAVAVSWLALAAVLLVRVDPATPSPAESFAAWWNKR